MISVEKKPKLRKYSGTGEEAHKAWEKTNKRQNDEMFG